LLTNDTTVRTCKKVKVPSSLSKRSFKEKVTKELNPTTFRSRVDNDYRASDKVTADRFDQHVRNRPQAKNKNTHFGEAAR